MGCKMRQVSQRFSAIWWKESGGCPTALGNQQQIFELQKIAQFTNFSCSERDVVWILQKLKRHLNARIDFCERRGVSSKYYTQTRCFWGGRWTRVDLQAWCSQQGALVPSRRARTDSHLCQTKIWGRTHNLFSCFRWAHQQHVQFVI